MAYKGRVGEEGGNIPPPEGWGNADAAVQPRTAAESLPPDGHTSLLPAPSTDRGTEGEVWNVNAVHADLEF